MKIYTLHDNIYRSPEKQANFGYSDGDEIENYILDLINRTPDLSIGSEELMKGIKDWPSLYHLNPKRVDLLRPLADMLRGKDILEIGSGCGAITRYLGEQGGRVTALEGSYRRACITRARCRDLDDVRVICDNFQDFDVPEKFDVITFIGVLEYSNRFIQADHPPEAMLQKARTFLKPGGHLIIAIENKLGLKYLAGAPEDHLDKPYFGIENRYTASTATTFGKAELEKLLERSGFPSTSFYYPFPDYKLPSVILTEKGICDPSFFIGELLSEKLEYFQSITYTNYFSTTLAAETFAQNDLLAHFSNSFLVLAGPGNAASAQTNKMLAYNYSTYRKKPFCKENVFRRDHSGQITVIKNRLYDLPYDLSLPIHQTLENEEYYEGVLLFKLLIGLVSQPGWTIEDLSSWVHSYYTILCKYAIIRDNQPFLEGKYADLTPFNILLKNGSDIQIFDQEWIIKEDLPVYYVFFRGIRFSLGAISFFSAPAGGTPLNLLELSMAIMNTFYHFTPAMLDDCLEREQKYFSPVNFNQPGSFDCGNIRIRGGQTEIDRLRAQLDESRHLVNEEKDRSMNLENERDWYIRTYVKRSLFGIIRDRIRL